MKAFSKFGVRALLTLLVAGGLGIVVLKQNAVARLRSEQQVLVRESEEARQLALENQGMAQLRTENLEVVKLRAENKDLPRLRNEARQLRRQVEELGKLRAENERLQATLNVVRTTAAAPVLPADFITRSALVDVGFGTPEAAMQTVFCAMCQGNLERLKQCSLYGTDGLGNDDEAQRKALTEQFKSFPGFRVAEKKIISADEVELSIQTSVDAAAVPAKFKKVGNEWKLQSM